MSSIIIEQYLESLKSYFKKEELSDKVLHIMEADTAQDVLKSQKMKKSKDLSKGNLDFPVKIFFSFLLLLWNKLNLQ